MAKQEFLRTYALPLIMGLALIAGVAAVASAATIRPSEFIGLFRSHWCGNGIIERRETCDDGNRVSGDGCSKRCQVEKYCSGHLVGDRYRSPDGCNICSCTTNGEVCTLRACAPTPKKCFSSEQCPRGQYCTTEDGDCQSACEPGAQVCIQVCAGICKPSACKPIVCPDGSRHPSCAADGHPINYFADPCLTSRPRCGNGICEEGEANECPACTYAEPPCMAPCRAGTCPQDCREPVSTSCNQQKAQFQSVVNANRSCTRNSDCILFEQSCPYVTCGEAINVSAQSKVRAAADAYVTCVEQSGGAIACAGCIQQSVACVNNRCVTR